MSCSAQLEWRIVPVKSKHFQSGILAYYIFTKNLDTIGRISTIDDRQPAVVSVHLARSVLANINKVIRAITKENKLHVRYIMRELQ